MYPTYSEFQNVSSFLYQRAWGNCFSLIFLLSPAFHMLSSSSSSSSSSTSRYFSWLHSFQVGDYEFGFFLSLFSVDLIWFSLRIAMPPNPGWMMLLIIGSSFLKALWMGGKYWHDHIAPRHDNIIYEPVSIWNSWKRRDFF